MLSNPTGWIRCVALAGVIVAGVPSLPAADRLALQPGDRVFFVGNTFAERMALYGYFETLLHCAYPDHRLVVRNLGWSGDEVDLRPRPKNTGTLEEHLMWNRADVIFLFYGMNESFAGDAGLAAWPGRLEGFLRSLQGQRFNGKSAPKLILVSPIAHEDLGPPLPNGTAIVERNRHLAAYTEAMKRVAAEVGVLFVDLFAPSRELMKAQRGQRFTINGIHLNERGYARISRSLGEALGLVPSPGSPPSREHADEAERLRRRVYEKNYFFFLLWRPLNPFYIWGDRAYCWEVDDPMAELERIALIVDERDRRIWDAPKPPPGSLTPRPPGTAEIWEQPPSHDAAGLASGVPAPKLDLVRRNGAVKRP